MKPSLEGSKQGGDRRRDDHSSTEGQEVRTGAQVLVCQNRALMGINV